MIAQVVFSVVVMTLPQSSAAVANIQPYIHMPTSKNLVANFLANNEKHM